MAVDSGTVQVVMPAMGDSVAEGTVLEWHKGVGDHVEVDETIVEISTDKVDAEVPSPGAGTITKIVAGEGDTIAVGAVLAEISSTDGGAGSRTATIPRPPRRLPATPEQAVAGAVTEAESTAASEAASGQTIDIVTPTGGESVTEGTILEWSVKVGDEVREGDTVVEISTDKVDMELPAPVSGTISEILFDEGDTVTVGQVIARMQPAGPGVVAARAEAKASVRMGPREQPRRQGPACRLLAPTGPTLRRSPGV